MTDLTLRPLSLGEILDRAFSLFRNNFLLFAGIVAVPQIIVLALGLFQTFFVKPPTVTLGTNGFPSLDPSTMAFTFVSIVVAVCVSLFSLGGVVLAVSRLYLGHPISASEALGGAVGRVGFLLGVSILTWLGVGFGFLLLIFPGIYLVCRWTVSVPAGLIEGLGPVAALKRGFGLTKGFAGRAFAIILLSVVLIYAAQLLFALPLGIPLAMSLNNPSMLRFWQAMLQIGNAVAATLVGPIPMIAISIFYYDLRVRKEAFDLQFMMNPSLPSPPDTSGMSSLAS